MARIEKITTGFLSGNLFQEAGYDEIASADNYQAALIAALEAEFPDAAIEVRYQRASGALPSPLKTAIEFADNAGDWQDEQRAQEQVEAIQQQVFEQFDWAVEATEGDEA